MRGTAAVDGRNFAETKVAGFVEVCYISAGHKAQDMIFRYFYRRRWIKAFGRFIPAHKIDEHIAGTSEWRAFKSFLPPRWFHTEEEIANSFLELRRLALNAVEKAKHKSGDQAPN